MNFKILIPLHFSFYFLAFDLFLKLFLIDFNKFVAEIARG